ncbi:MAG: S8/S53 family peptidase, partial [bacterium]|nr:S8/S53 family peptidase [bacterium]
MIKHRKSILLLFIVGIVVIVWVKLYVNSEDKKHRLARKQLSMGLFNTDLQNFTALRSVRTQPRKLKALDLKDKYDVLLKCTFNTLTQWPQTEKMPVKFNPSGIIAMGMEPGLGIRELHKQGITGKGVNVAIIDYPFRRSHQEYADKVVGFFLTNGKDTGTMGKPATHGTATASLLVGEKCGVAPGAMLYFFGAESSPDYAPIVAGVLQIIQFNKDRKLKERIRVLSISIGFKENMKHLNEFKKAIKIAEKSGITIVFCRESFSGFGCPPYMDRDDPSNYNICYYMEGFKDELSPGTLYLPCDHRSTACEQGDTEYTYWGDGGLSWAAPYLAGVITLGYQVDPNLKQDKILQYIRETGNPFNRGVIINPVAFIK